MNLPVRMTKWTRCAVTRLTLSPLVDVAFAQEQRRPAAAAQAAPSHRFVDAMNIALTGVESAALLADGIRTQRALTRYPEIFREADPIARPFVSRGWPGQSPAVCSSSGRTQGCDTCFTGRSTTASSAGARILSVDETLGAIHGAREIRRMERRIAR
jgi:hypothetical protein